MTIVKKFSPLFPNYLGDLFGRDTTDSFLFPATGLNTPAVNILETESDFLLEVAVPGFQKSDFSINLNRNLLTISGKKETAKEESRKYVKKEFSYNSFQRVFTLSDTVEQEKIAASYENGILKVVVPKREEAKIKPAKSIEIR